MQGAVPIACYHFLLMNITIPELSLVVLMGASGSGKSSFARQHFLPTEVLSSDACRELGGSLRGLEREGFRHVFILNSVEQIESVSITREPLYNNRKSEHGPFDVIGDVHGCGDELEELLALLGYRIETELNDGSPWS